MIDLAALTQALDWVEHGTPMKDGTPLAERQGVITAGARIPTRLWQPCQTCGGTGTKVTEIRTVGSYNSNMDGTDYVSVTTDEIREECPSCGGVGVEPTPQAVEAGADDIWVTLPRYGLSYPECQRVAKTVLMALWRVANEEDRLMAYNPFREGAINAMAPFAGGYEAMLALDALLDYLTVELGKVEGWKIRAEYWTTFDLIAALRGESDQ